MDRLVTTWTGRRADSLRQALRMTNESFAEHLGVAVRSVAYWRNRPGMVPSPAMQEILDAALARAPERAQDHYWALQETGEPGGEPASPPEAEDPDSLTSWLTSSSVSDDAITALDQATARVAESHAQAAPAVVLAGARQVQASAQDLLQAGRIRHSQARELLRINGNLLAHISLLLSDLGDDTEGEEYGNAALAYLQEAGASQAPAWYVLAKIARWRHDYAKSADLARAGLDHGGRDPMRVELACYEANAAALAGDTARALRDAAGRRNRRRASARPDDAVAVVVPRRADDHLPDLGRAPHRRPGPGTRLRRRLGSWTGAAKAACHRGLGPDQDRHRHRPAQHRRPRRGSGRSRPGPDSGTRVPDSHSHRLARRPAHPARGLSLHRRPRRHQPARTDPRLHPRGCHRAPGRNTPMTPMPAEFTDRWRDRAEPAPGQGLVYWHMLVGQHPEAVAASQDARQRLAPFDGLHLTPLMWLHMTTLIAGPSDEISPDHIQQMAKSATRHLAGTPPITVTLGKVLYHPEAIMVAVTPAAALAPSATRRSRQHAR